MANKSTNHPKTRSGNQKNIQPGNVIRIGGNVNTGGGDLAAGNITKRDVSQRHNSDDIINIQSMFQPIYEKIQSNEIEKAITKTNKDDVNSSFIKRRPNNIGQMAPDILDVVLDTIANQIMGLKTVSKNSL